MSQIEDVNFSQLKKKLGKRTLCAFSINWFKNSSNLGIQLNLFVFVNIRSDSDVKMMARQCYLQMIMPTLLSLFKFRFSLGNWGKIDGHNQRFFALHVLGNSNGPSFENWYFCWVGLGDGLPHVHIENGLKTL